MQPLWHFVDDASGDAVAVTIETDRQGVTFPVVYLRRGTRVTETRLDPHPLHDFTGDEYRHALAELIK